MSLDQNITLWADVPEPIETTPSYSYDDNVFQVWTYKDGGLKARVGVDFTLKDPYPFYSLYGNDERSSGFHPQGVLLAHNDFYLLKNTKFLNGNSITPPTNWLYLYNSGSITFPEIGKIRIKTNNSRCVLYTTTNVKENQLKDSETFYFSLYLNLNINVLSQTPVLLKDIFNLIGSGDLVIYCEVNNIIVEYDTYTLTYGNHFASAIFTHTNIGYTTEFHNITMQLGSGVQGNTSSDLEISNITLTHSVINPIVQLTDPNQVTICNGTTDSLKLSGNGLDYFNEWVNALGEELCPNPTFSGPYTDNVPHGFIFNNPNGKYSIKALNTQDSTDKDICIFTNLNAYFSGNGLYPDIPSNLIIEDHSYISKFVVSIKKTNYLESYQGAFGEHNQFFIENNTVIYEPTYIDDKKIYTVFGQEYGSPPNPIVVLGGSSAGQHVTYYELSIKKFTGFNFTMCTSLFIPKIFNENDVYIEILGMLSLYYTTEGYISAYMSFNETDLTIPYVENCTYRFFIVARSVGGSLFGYKRYSTDGVPIDQDIVWSIINQSLSSSYAYQNYLTSSVQAYLQYTFFSKKTDYTDEELISITDGLSN